MRRQVAVFMTVLAFGAVILTAGPDAQAAATAITACQAISQPGSYVLANNLTAADDCLVITAGTDSVSIDLGGFSISGNGSGDGITTAAPGPGTRLHRGIAVRNGSISNFQNGVDLDFAEGSIVEGLRVFDNSLDGIHAFGIARGNTAVDNRQFGIIVFGTVTGNYAEGNNTGFGGGETVTGNTALRNRLGMDLRSGSTVIGNTAHNNTGTGISVECPSNVTNNTAVDNAGGNLVLSGSNCLAKDNVPPK